MPITKSAIKKLRVDKTRAQVNLRLKKRYRKAVNKHLAKKTLETLKLAYSLIDRAVKKHIIHKNKAARLKSQVAKVVAVDKPAKTKTKKATTKKTTKKTASTKTTKPAVKKTTQVKKTASKTKSK